MNTTPGSDVYATFKAISYECSIKTKVSVPGKPFQPSLMFENKAGVYPSTVQVLPSRIGS